MTRDDALETIKRYGERFHAHGYDPRTLGWSKGTQQVRFAAAEEQLRSSESVLDVGCGFGDLFGFLVDRGWHGRYVGVDLVPELVEEGQKRFGPRGAEFVVGDVTSLTLDWAPHTAIGLGLFNHRLREGHLAFVEETVRAMWRLSAEVVIVDFLCASADRPRGDLFYATIDEVSTLAARLTRRFLIDHSYMPFEFQLRLWHDDRFTPEAPFFS